jgi:hypothetical protein
VRTPKNNAVGAETLYQFQSMNTTNKEGMGTIPFKFRWKKKKSSTNTPSKYGYAHAASSILKKINFNLDDIKNWAILDSGATSHFLVTDASATGVSVATNPVTVSIPDGSKLTSTHKRELDLPQLPKAARSGHVIPGMSSYSLMSVVTLCNAGCKVVFEAWGIGVTVTCRGTIVLEGKKCVKTGLWMVPITKNTESQEQANFVGSSAPKETNACVNQQVNEDIESHFGGHAHFMANAIQTSSKGELANYHHQSLGSPIMSSMINALKNHPDELLSMPGMNKSLITKYLEPSTATAKGHMVRVRKNIRSTNSDRPAILQARQEVEDMDPAEQVCSAIENEVFCFAILRDETDNTIYSDLAGRFPIESFTGMNYVFVCYVYKLNTILLRTMKNREDAEMVLAFKSCYTELNAKGHHPTLHILDNECSRAVKEYVSTERTDIQLVEAYNHRVNAAEHGCKAAKYHTIATLCTIDPSCPVQLWDRFIPQIEATLNILRTSRIDRTKSAYEALNGKKFIGTKHPSHQLDSERWRSSTLRTDSHGHHMQLMHSPSATRQTIIASCVFGINSLAGA